MKLPHLHVKNGHVGNSGRHMTAHVDEMFYTFRYRVD